MYSAFRDWAERILRIPPQPAPPVGDEASARVFRAAPAFYKYRVIMWAMGAAFTLLFWVLVFAIPTVAVFWAQGALDGLRTVITFGVFALLLFRALFSFAVLRLDFEKRWYLVTDRSLRIREGVIIVREMTVTFANIQNLSITEGPIQRALGIADLKVETAGGGGGGHGNQKQLGPNLHTAWFRGIENAPEVKELIQQRLRALKDTGLGHREEEHLAHPREPALPIDVISSERSESRNLKLPPPSGLAISGEAKLEVTRLRGSAVPLAMTGTPLPPAPDATEPRDYLAALRAVRDEARALRSAASGLVLWP